MVSDTGWWWRTAGGASGRCAAGTAVVITAGRRLHVYFDAVRVLYVLYKTPRRVHSGLARRTHVVAGFAICGI